MRVSGWLLTLRSSSQYYDEDELINVRSVEIETPAADPNGRGGSGRLRLLPVQYPLLLFIILVLVGVLMWINHMQKQIAHYRDRARQAQKEQEAVLSLIDKLGEKITSKIDLEETLNIITRYIMEATSAESGAIFVAREEERTLQARVVIACRPGYVRIPHAGRERPIMPRSLNY